MQRLRVLEVVEASGAGVGRHVRFLCEGLAEQGHEVTVAYAPYRMDHAFRRFISEHQGKIRFVTLDISNKLSPASDLKAVVPLLRLLKAAGERFDVVHGHSSKGGAISRIAGRLSGVPTVYTPHGLIMTSPTLSETSRTFYTSVERVLGYAATSRFIATSTDEREFALKLKLVPSGRVVTIENAVEDGDFGYFDGADARANDPRKPLTFGSTMRFSNQKAPEHLVEAFVRLSADLPMRLVVAGDGDLLPEIEKRARESNASNDIVFPGWKANVKEFLQDLDVFVVSSRYESGLSYSTMEAMAAGLPIVSTDVFGTRGTIATIAGNVIVPAGDSGALADGMGRMITGTDLPSLRRSLQETGRANREYARTHFSQSETTRRTLEVYGTLCYGRASRTNPEGN